MSENTAFDPAAPEGDASAGSQYLSRKEAKLIIGIAAILFIAMIPIYLYMREKAYRSTCVKNLNGIREALTLYSAQHDDRFPPLYNENGKGEPDADANGYAYTWITDIYPLKNDRVDFICPTATIEDYAYSINPNGGAPIPSTYGFYAPYASYSTNLIDHQESVVVLAETSNKGANDTYDPKPFSSTKYDGYIIGWNNSNEAPNPDTHTVTRLAFPGSKDGTPSKAAGRHAQFINAVTASGMKIFLSPDDMRTDYNPAKYSLSGHWQEPPATTHK